MARAVLQQVVGDGHQGVFFAKEFAVLANKHEAVDVRVYNDSEVALRFRD